jgi:pimeloyl-ACP methyl ester carboxylesterase
MRRPLSRRLRRLRRLRASAFALSLAAGALVALTGACSSSSSSPTPAASPPPYAPAPASAIVDPGVRREIVLVDAKAPPPNPLTGEATPSALNRSRFVRYRVDASAPKPARAIVIMMPGFLGGAGSFDPLARALVRRSKDDAAGPIEVWAIDRRSNLLEDTHGSDVAEVRQDTSYAERYYVEGEAVEGKTFAGFKDQSDLPFESEWGMATTIDDLRAVVSLVPAAERKGRVVLLGHSLGATIAEAYASWDFLEGGAGGGSTRGFDELAGLVLIDGVSDHELDAPSAFDTTAYTATEPGDVAGGGGAFSSPNLAKIRKYQPFISLPFLGVAVYEQAERMAMAATFAPAAPRLEDGDLTNTLAIVLGLTSAQIPKLTNEAAFGFAFDDASCNVVIAGVSCGAGKGGPVASYDSLFGPKLIHPSDPTASYTWVPYDQTSPTELTDLRDAARSWYFGPGLNFAEWYFPARLTLDASFVGSLNIAESDLRTTYGLRARHGAALDLPILALAAQLTLDPLVAGAPQTAKSYDKLRAMVAANPIGAGRPLAGTPRSDERAFQVRLAPGFTHIDPLAAADVGRGKEWFDALAAWVRANTAAGGVVIPVRE